MRAGHRSHSQLSSVAASCSPSMGGLSPTDSPPRGLPMQLYIGNKNYSSWSMRPWVLMTQAGIPFDEKKLRFDSFEPGSQFKVELARHSPTGRVPLLVDDGFAVWDTLAIAEYLAERFPDK